MAVGCRDWREWGCSVGSEHMGWRERGGGGGGDKEARGSMIHRAVH